jgi:hypothetical protein
MRWIGFSRGKTPEGSFHWVCDVLGLSPSATRKAVIGANNESRRLRGGHILDTWTRNQFRFPSEVADYPHLRISGKLSSSDSRSGEYVRADREAVEIEIAGLRVHSFQSFQKFQWFQTSERLGQLGKSITQAVT